MISDLIDTYWRRVLAATAVPATSLSVFRWVIGLFQLLVYVPFVAWIDDVPHGLFDPPQFSLAYLVGGFPPAPFFAVLDIVAVLALVAMTIGWRTRAATLVVVVTRLVGTTFTYSFGKIDHTDIMLTWLLMALAFSDWGEHYTLAGALRQATAAPNPDERTRRERRPSKPLAMFATVLAFGMFTAGFPKLRVWVDFDLSTSGVLSWFYPNRLTLGRDGLLDDLLPGVPAILLELTDYFAVCMELTAVVFLLVGRRAWLGYLAVATAFHLANVLVLNIAFAGQVITYLVFAGLVLPQRVDPRKAVFAGTAICALAGAWSVARTLVGRGAVTILNGDRPAQTQHLLYVSLIVCVAVLVSLLRALALGWRRVERAA